MLKVSGNNHRQHELALIVGECRVHESANLCSTYLLAESFVQNSGYVQVERLIGQVHKAGSGEGTAIDYGVEVVGLSYAILHVKVAGELYEVSKVLRRTKIAADKFTHG
jgi:hypothetical protein